MSEQQRQVHTLREKQEVLAGESYRHQHCRGKSCEIRREGGEQVTGCQALLAGCRALARCLGAGTGEAGQRLAWRYPCIKQKLTNCLYAHPASSATALSPAHPTQGGGHRTEKVASPSAGLFLKLSLKRKADKLLFSSLDTYSKVKNQWEALTNINQTTECPSPAFTSGLITQISPSSAV